MSKLIIAKGLPASGKSTICEQLVKEGNTVRINKDLLRTMLHFNKFSHTNEEKTQNAARTLANWFLSQKQNVVIDDTNLNPKTLQGWKDLAKTHNATIEYIDVSNISPETCILRDNQREKKVGAHVIQKMALQYLDYMKGKKVVISDLDGTLCDTEWRQQYINLVPKDWKSFFNGIPHDKIRESTLKEIQNTLKDFKEAELVLVSARPEEYRKVTEDWLKTNLPIPYTALIMRENHDKRPDTEVKSEIYEKYLKQMDIISIYDDRPCIIRMWKEKGLNVIDVGKGIEF